ncbi:MBL fold metallo-hydrolase [Deinococcus aluminii]|uniref:Hydroxyacylglutathione hydrolase n=1 Tax=Deinococcus aluminii TaxID=1656885 RepID=A0ABP9XAI4_9DEIO
MNGLALTRLGLVNVYLVPEDDGFTLIDAGLPGMAPVILNAARAAGQPIRRLLLTHAHGDHVGSLDDLKAALPDLEVLVGKGEEGNLVHSHVRTPLKRWLSEGERVGHLRAVATPGHAPGHLAFLDERDGTLYAGDTFVNVLGLRVVTELHPLFPMPTLGTSDPAQALESARRLLDLPLASLALGHGPVLSVPRAAMTRAVQRAEHALQEPPSPFRLALARRVNRLFSAGGRKGS